MDLKELQIYTVKAFVVTPQNDKKIHNFQRGLRQNYKIFITDENLFVCILIYLLVS